MREVTFTKKVFKYKELPESIQNEILENEINFLMTTDMWDANEKVLPKYRNSNLYKAWKKAKKEKRPWFFGSYILDYCKEEIINSFREMEFFENGQVYSGE
jgi:hypothetical protein